MPKSKAATEAGTMLANRRWKKTPKAKRKEVSAAMHEAMMDPNHPEAAALAEKRRERAKKAAAASARVRQKKATEKNSSAPKVKSK